MEMPAAASRRSTLNRWRASAMVREAVGSSRMSSPGHATGPSRSPPSAAGPGTARRPRSGVDAHLEVLEDAPGPAIISPFRPGQAVRGLAAGEHVLGDAQCTHEAPLLEHHGDPRVRRRRARPAPPSTCRRARSPRVGSVDAGAQDAVSGLAGAVLADERMDLAGATSNETSESARTPGKVLVTPRMASRGVSAAGCRAGDGPPDSVSSCNRALLPPLLRTRRADGAYGAPCCSSISCRPHHGRAGLSGVADSGADPPARAPPRRLWNEEGMGMTGPLEGRVALVTGSSRGIGRAIAERLAVDGARVMVTYVSNEPEAAVVVDAIERAGGEAAAAAVDVSRRDDVERLVRSAVDRFGRIDILVTTPASTSPGVSSRPPRMTGIGPSTSTSRAPTSAPRRWRPGSSSGARARSSTSPRTRALPPVGDAFHRVRGVEGRHERADQGARPRARSCHQGQRHLPRLDPDRHARDEPGIATGSVAETPLARWGTPDDVAAAAAFLASDDASFITGELMLVAGGRGMH